MLINEELHSAFAGLRAAVEKTEEAVRAIQQAEQAKLREALRSQAEASKKAELAAVEIKEATLEADAAREAQSVSEARSDKLSEKLQDKREEVRKLDELLEKYEDKLLVKRKEAKAMEEYMDKLEALLQKEKRGGTSGKKTGSKSASARAASPCQVENYDQESTMSRSRTRSPAGPDGMQHDSTRKSIDRVAKADARTRDAHKNWGDCADHEGRPTPSMKASEHKDSESEICEREDGGPPPAGFQDPKKEKGCDTCSEEQEGGTTSVGVGHGHEGPKPPHEQDHNREGFHEKEQEQPSGERHEEVGPESCAATGRVGNRACTEENERPPQSQRPSPARSPDSKSSRRVLHRSAGRRDGGQDLERSYSRAAPSSRRSRPGSRQRHRSTSRPSNRSHSRRRSHSKPTRRSNSRQRSHSRRSRSARSYSRRRSSSSRRSCSKGPRREDERRREDRIKARGLGTRRDRSRTTSRRRDSGYNRRASGRSRSASNRYSRGYKGKEKSCCIYFLLDKCFRGNNCHDLHPDKSEVKAILEKFSRTPCRFGEGCTRRDCVFKHPPGRNADRPKQNDRDRNPTSA